jgi:hypothetical protein
MHHAIHTDAMKTKAAVLVLTLVVLAGMAIPSFASAQQSTGSTTTLDVEAAQGSIASLNATAVAISSAIDDACQTVSVNSSLSAGFLQYCASGKAEVADSFAALRNAEAAISESSLSSSMFIGQARGNLSLASTIVSELAGYSYTARATAFVNGQMAVETAAASSAVATQQRLSNQYSALNSSFESSAEVMDNVATSVVVHTSTVSSEVSSISFMTMDADIGAQQTLMTWIGANLTLLSQQLPSSLPVGITSTLQSDIKAAQTSLVTYNQDLKASVTDAASFPKIVVDKANGNISLIVNQAIQTEEDGMTFGASFSALQIEMNTVAGQFPLLTILLTWNTTIGLELQSFASGSSTVDLTLNAVQTEMATLTTDLSELNIAVEAALTLLKVDAGLIQNTTTLSSSETEWLNATDVSVVAQVPLSLQTTANAASAFATTSQEVLQLQLNQTAATSETLSTRNTSFQAQVSASSTAMAAASALVAGDLRARSQAQTSATAEIQMALSSFSEQKVAAGIDLLSQASVSLEAASEHG